MSCVSYLLRFFCQIIGLGYDVSYIVSTCDVMTWKSKTVSESKGLVSFEVVGVAGCGEGCVDCHALSPGHAYLAYHLRST